MAILLVMTRHFPQTLLPGWFTPLANFGWSGVDLFFVLSGYLITTQMLSGMSIPEFYLRRTLRILPPYWVALMLYFLLPGFAECDGIAPLWKFLLFVQNFGLDVKTQPAFSHAWSLCIEEHFYLLLCPLMALTFRKERARGFLAVFALALLGQALIRAALWSPQIASDHARFLTLIYYPTYVHLDGLIVGAALAVLDRRGAFARISHPIVIVAGLFFVLWGAVVTLERESFAATVFGFPLVSLGYGMLVVAALRTGPIPGGSVATALAWLAYPAYLIHKPLLQLASDFSSSWCVNLLLAFGLVFLAAAVLHFLVERPSLSLRDRLVRRYYGKREKR